jgi:hypothetical protein
MLLSIVVVFFWRYYIRALINIILLPGVDPYANFGHRPGGVRGLFGLDYEKIIQKNYFVKKKF